VLFDTLHHAVNNAGESLKTAAFAAFRTWKKADGLPMVDYSDQKEAARRGAHRDSIDLPAFTAFLEETGPCDFDVMLEIKDKEASALKAGALAAQDPRFYRRGSAKKSLK
jgi:UV DNA damage endonuclease